MTKDFDSEVKDCNTMKDFRKAAKKCQLREEVRDSVAPVKALQTGVFQRLKLEKHSGVPSSNQGTVGEHLGVYFLH